MNKKKIFIIFRNDDLCALSDIDHERAVFTAFEKAGIPQVVGVIPRVVADPHDHRPQDGAEVTRNTAIMELLREHRARGLAEIAQHGYSHQTNILHPSRADVLTGEKTCPGISGRWIPYAPANPEGYSEFNGLPANEQKQAITQGTGLLEEAFQARPRVFIFPWDRLNPAALDILAETGFEYVQTGFKYVQCSRADTFNERLTCLGYILRDRDIYQLPLWLKNHENIRSPFLIQVAYHSWMFSCKEIQHLSGVLEHVSRAGHVQCVLPSQISSLVPGFDNGYRKHTRFFQEYGRRKVDFVGFNDYRSIYVINEQFYKDKQFSQDIYSLFIETVGLKKTALAGLFVILAGIAAIRLFPDIRPLLFILLLIFCIQAGMLFRKLLRLKNKTYAAV
jgi:predicted deacetylase